MECITYIKRSSGEVVSWHLAKVLVAVRFRPRALYAV